MQSVVFFISSTKEDGRWAEWIAWELEKADYDCCLQAWDFPPGSDFVRRMRKAIESAKQVVVVLSPAYLTSAYATAELDAALARDPSGDNGVLVPVRIDNFEPGDLLKSRVYIDLVSLDETQARNALLQGIKASRVGRAKPLRVSFPGPVTFPKSPIEISITPAPVPHLLRRRALLIGADPGGAPAVRYELDLIAHEFSLAKDQIETYMLFNPPVENLAQEIARYVPEILHFTGHMDGEYILMQSRSGEARTLDYEAFAGMLRAASEPAQLVYLNASFSLGLAEKLRDTVISAVIAVAGNIKDTTATAVSVEFYRQLMKGTAVDSAFGYSISHAKALGVDQSELPSLMLKPGVIGDALTFGS